MGLIDSLVTMAVASRSDQAGGGWLNMVTGRGTSRDKLTATRFSSISLLDDEQLRALYYGNSIAARICDEVVLDTRRAGFTITEVDDELRDQMLKRMKKLHALEALYETMKRARRFGGALSVMSVVGAGMPEDPMISGAQIENIRAVDRRRAQPVSWDKESGRPSVYMVTLQTPGHSETVYVHASKCVRFDGIPVDEDESLILNGWSYPVLQRVYDNLRKYDSATDSIGTMLDEASVGVYKIKDLVNMLTGKKKDELTARMQVIDMVKSTMRSLMLDSDGEDFTRVAMQFNGVADVSDRLAYRLASAAGMPLTKLLGVSPQGMNATGESDVRMWNDQVGRWRSEEAEEEIVRFLRLLAASIVGDGPLSDNVGLEWANLWTPSASEQADLYAKVAGADKTYFDMGLEFERIVLARFGGGKYNPTASPRIDDQELEATLTKVVAFSAGDEVGKLELTPSAAEIFTLVWEARASKGLEAMLLPDGSRDPDNDLTVAAYKAKQEAQQTAAGAAVGAAEGAAAALDVPGASDVVGGGEEK